MATNALASAAYRDSDATEILKANSEWHKSEVKPGLSKLFKSDYFKPNLGEAYSRAVQERMLGGGRGALIQSFGTDPQTVVEHCLSATRLRKARDTRLTLITAVFGFAFLPGLILWVLAFRLRDFLNKSKDKVFRALGGLLLVVFGVVAAVFLIAMPLTGFPALYLRAAAIAPLIGWMLAKRAAESSVKDLRARWDGLLSGGGVSAKIPEAAPKNPNETAREALRQGLEKLSAEQQSNAVFYAGPKGILGMGTRWGSWQLAEELVPEDPAKEIHQFRSWDVVRAIHDQLKLLERGPLNSGGFPTPSVKHWIVSPVGENAGSVSRPEGEDVATFQIKPHEIQRICNHQQFGSGNRHYLGVQFTLWDGQLVITMLITVTVLHETLRIEVTGHALGPVHSLFLSKLYSGHQDGEEGGQILGDPHGQPPPRQGERGREARPARPLHLVSAAARLPGRQDRATRAFRPAARLGGQAVGPPLHGRRRHADGNPGPARRPRGDDASAQGTRRRRRALRQPLHDPQRHGPGPRPEEGRRLRRVSPPGAETPLGRARTDSDGLLRRTTARPSHTPASIARVSPSSCGSTLVCPTTGMKLVSPPQRGTTCWWRCAAIPAPASAPWFIPMLKPCAPDAARSATMARLVKSASSAVSAPSSSV